MKTMPLPLATAIFAAASSLHADPLAITPATLPVATQQVAYAQTFTATGGSGSYSWSVVPWSYETAEPTYSAGANETPLWEGSQMKGNTACKLPFTFPYCGTQYDTIYVDSHGFLMFDPDYSSSDYAYKSYLSYGYTGLAVLWKNSAYASGWVDTSVDGQVSFRFVLTDQASTKIYTWAQAWRVRSASVSRCSTSPAIRPTPGRTRRRSIPTDGSASHTARMRATASLTTSPSASPSAT